VLFVVGDGEEWVDNRPEKANSITFRFNRLTGEAQMDYVNKSTEGKTAGFGVVIKDASQKGNCSKFEHAF
jgi:hypothetical protein